VPYGPTPLFFPAVPARGDGGRRVDATVPAPANIGTAVGAEIDHGPIGARVLTRFSYSRRAMRRAGTAGAPVAAVERPAAGEEVNVHGRDGGDAQGVSAGRAGRTSLGRARPALRAPRPGVAAGQTAVCHR
jgi:hypothetical protein